MKFFSLFFNNFADILTCINVIGESECALKPKRGNMSDLYHLIYFSSAKNSVQPEELLTLLEKVRPRNAKRGITGILLYV
jgi:hypothetical protein